MSKPILVLTASIVLAFAAAPSAGKMMAQEASHGAKNSVKAAPPDPLARAKKIYGVDCSMCHGDNGNGQTDLAKDMQLTLANWTDPKALADKDDQELFKIIRAGKDKMPPEDASRAKDEDIKGLVQYIREFSKGQQAATGGPGKGK